MVEVNYLIFCCPGLMFSMVKHPLDKWSWDELTRLKLQRHHQIISVETRDESLESRKMWRMFDLEEKPNSLVLLLQYPRISCIPAEKYERV